MRIERPSCFVPAPIGPPRVRPSSLLLAAKSDASPSDPSSKHKPPHNKHQQHTPDRRAQLLSLSKAVVLGSLTLTAVPDPSSLAGGALSPLASLLAPHTAAANAAAAEAEGVMPGLVVNKGAAMSTGMAARMIQVCVWGGGGMGFEKGMCVYIYAHPHSGSSTTSAA